MRFSRYIGIDYSGAGKPDDQNKHLQVFVAEDGDAKSESSPNRSGRWSRRQVAQFCADEILTENSVVIGIDHAFSLPKSYMERYDIGCWSAFLDDFQSHWPTDKPDVTVKSLRAENQRTGTAEEFRLVERWTPNAKSVFQFDVPGQVAPSTHAGIPWLRWLRNLPDIRSRIHFWPFDGLDVPYSKSVLAEVYPSLFRKRYDRPDDRSVDEHDAFATATWLREMDNRGVLGKYFRPPLSSSEILDAQLEGWILGIW